jgi:hypothetical protein
VLSPAIDLEKSAITLFFSEDGIFSIAQWQLLSTYYFQVAVACILTVRIFGMELFTCMIKLKGFYVCAWLMAHIVITLFLLNTNDAQISCIFSKKRIL